MKHQTMPTFPALQEALAKTTLKLHPSQVHGMISGILCGSLEKEAAWESLITGSKSNKKTHQLLQALFEVTNQQLKEFLFEFELFLPDEEEALPQRAEALTLWCQGFLTGLKIVQIPITNRENSDTTEAINDLIEIAKMNYDDVVTNDEDEAAYIELVEYIRMAVILIYQTAHEKEGEQSHHLRHLH